MAISVIVARTTAVCGERSLAIKHLVRSPSLALANHIKEAKGFLVIGVANVVFTYAVYQAVNFFTSYTIAFTVSFASGILFSAILNSRYSFSVHLKARGFLLFVVVCVVNYFIGLHILKALIEIFGFHEAIAPLVVIATMVPISFVGTRLALTGSLLGAAGGKR